MLHCQEEQFPLLTFWFAKNILQNVILFLKIFLALVYTTDRSKAVFPILFLFCVAL